jgi:carbonic anhydrase
MNQDIGLVENWLRNIRDVYRLHYRQLDAITDPKARHRRLVELNVVEQCLNVCVLIIQAFVWTVRCCCRRRCLRRRSPV